MSNNSQLDRFTETLFQHPFRTGVFSPRSEREATTPLEFIQVFADHFEDCCYSLCMGYHNALLIAYFAHLSQAELSELLASLKEQVSCQFLKRAHFFIEREARSGCAPEEVFVNELRDSDSIVTDSSGRTFVRGRTLAKDTRASRVHIQHLTTTGESFVIPGIAPTPPGSKFLSVHLVADILKHTVDA